MQGLWKYEIPEKSLFQSLKGIIGYCNQYFKFCDEEDLLVSIPERDYRLLQPSIITSKLINNLFQSLKGIIGYCNPAVPPILQRTKFVSIPERDYRLLQPLHPPGLFFLIF